LKLKVAVIILLNVVFFLDVKAQCSFTIIQEDFCNSNGIIQIDVDPSFTAPFNYTVVYPLGSGIPDFVLDNSTLTTIQRDGLSGGIHQVSVVDANGLDCSQDVEIITEQLITNFFVFSEFLYNGYGVSCNGACDGEITFNISGGSSQYEVEWYIDSIAGVPIHTSIILPPNANSPTFGSSAQTDLCAGNYSFLITSSSGCQNIRTYSLAEPDSLEMTVALTDINCVGDASGAIDVEVTGGVGDQINPANGNIISNIPYNYSWTSNSGFSSNSEDLLNVASDEYSIVITDANDCVIFDTYTVEDTIPLLEIQLVNVDSVSCFGGSNGSLEVLATGGTFDYQYSIDGGQNQQALPIFSNLIEGTYEITVTDANGCVASINVDIHQYSQLFFNEVMHQDILCADSLGSFELQGLGGNSDYNFVLEIPQESGLFEDLSQGNYSVTLFDGLNCFTDTTIIITELAISTSISSTDPSCYGFDNGEITVSVSGGTPLYTFDLNGVIQNNGLFTDLVAGTYQLNVTDINGCSSDSLITITEPTQVVVNLDSLFNLSCFESGDGSVFTTASGGAGNYTYFWLKDSNPLLIQNDELTSISAGVYTIEVADDDFCESVATNFVVTEPDVLEINLITLQDLSCDESNDGLIELSAFGGTTPYSFQWSGLNTSQDALIEDLIIGDYTVDLIDSNLCQTSFTYSISQPDTISFTNIVSIVACNNDSTGSLVVNPSGGTPNFNFSITPDLGVQSSGVSFEVLNLPAQLYTVSALDNNGCLFEQDIEITESDLIVASFDIFSESCNNNNASFTVNPSGGVGNFSFNWPGFTENSQTLASISGGLTYSVNVTDDFGCVKTFSEFVPEIQSVSISEVTSANSSCAQSSNASVQATAFNGSLPYTFNLFLGTTLVTSELADSISVNLENLSDGNYTLSVKDNNDCEFIWISDIELVSPSDISLSIDSAKTSFELQCQGDNIGEIFLNISGGTPFNGDFYWMFVNDPSFSQQISADSITGLEVGSYDLSVQDANGCFASISHNISEPPSLFVESIVTDVACYNDSTGEVSVSISGGTPNYVLTTISDNVTITEITTDSLLLTNLYEGQYFFDVVDGNGCELLNSTFYIAEPSQLEALSTTSSLESCLGGDGSANVSVAGGTEPYQYLWTYDSNFQLPILLTNGDINPTSQNANPQFLSEGLHYVHIWDARGCYTLDSVNVNKASVPNLSLLGTVNNICHNGEMGQISINAVDGNPYYQFTIDGGVNWQFTPTFYNLSENFYNITVRDSLGCTDQVTNIEITAPEPIDVIVSTSNVSCFGFSDGFATVTSVTGGTGSYSYSWQNDVGVNLWPGNLSAIQSTVMNLLPASYQLIIEDENECTTTYSPVVIGEPLDVSVDLDIISNHNGLEISCFGSSDGDVMATAQGGTGEFTFSWSSDFGSIETNTSATFDTIFSLTSGTYYVNVEDDNGCFASDDVNLDQPNEIIVDFENIINIRCEGQEAGQATAIWSGGLGLGIYNVVWTDSNANILSLSSTVNNLSVGEYTATVSDQNGCSEDESIIIDYSELFAITNTIETTQVSCFGTNDASFDFAPVGGWPPYTHNWNDVLNQQSSTAFGLSSSQWYIDVITDAQGCVVYDSIFVTEPSPLTFEGTTTDIDCFGDNTGTMILTASGGTPDYNFAWAGPVVGNIIDSETVSLLTLDAGTYDITVTDAEGCQTLETFNIEQPQFPIQVNTVPVFQHVQCFGGNDGKINDSDILVSGGTPSLGSAPYFFNWLGKNPNLLSEGSNDVIVSDANGCTLNVEYTISQPEILQIDNLVLIDENCAGDHGVIFVTASGGTPLNDGYYNYSIDSDYNLATSAEGIVEIDFPVVSEETDTIFTLTLTDANGCKVDASGLEIHPARIFDYGASIDVCLGDSVEIDVVFGNFNYFTWSASNNQNFIMSQLSNSISLVVEESITISATGTDNYNCEFTDNFNINTLIPEIEIIEGNQIEIVRGEQVTLNVSGDQPYLWSNLKTTSSITETPLSTTHFMVYALDNNVGCVGSDSIKVFVGMNEGFSPNDDGFNDMWVIEYLNDLVGVRIEMFNRYGNKLWEGDSPNITNWDGKYNGSEVPVGTYYYLITFDESSNKEPLTGPVTIVR
jgi:gliding motility-associated-like protein